MDTLSLLVWQQQPNNAAHKRCQFRQLKTKVQESKM